MRQKNLKITAQNIQSKQMLHLLVHILVHMSSINVSCCFALNICLNFHLVYFCKNFLYRLTAGEIFLMPKWENMVSPK